MLKQYATRMLKTDFASLGFLRLGVFGLAVLDMLWPAIYSWASPLSDDIETFTIWEVIATLVAPTMAPLILVVILFDMMMSRVRAAEEQGAERERLNVICRVELIVIGIMLAYWVPFFKEMTT